MAAMKKVGGKSGRPRRIGSATLSAPWLSLPVLNERGLARKGEAPEHGSVLHLNFSISPWCPRASGASSTAIEGKDGTSAGDVTSWRGLQFYPGMIRRTWSGSRGRRQGTQPGTPSKFLYFSVLPACARRLLHYHRREGRNVRS